MTEKEVEAVFVLAGIDFSTKWELINNYWPRVLDYAEIIFKSSWWLVQTEFGLVKIGWRKRVISIDWSATAIRAVVTEDEVTKDSTMVHAWSVEDAIKYLKALKKEAQTDLDEQSNND